MKGALLPTTNLSTYKLQPGGPKQPTAYPVPASFDSLVNLTVLTKASWFPTVSAYHGPQKV